MRLQEYGSIPVQGLGRKLLDEDPFHEGGVLDAQSSHSDDDSTSIMDIKFKAYQIILMVISGSIFLFSFSAAIILIIFCTPFREHVRTRTRITYEKVWCCTSGQKDGSSAILDNPAQRLYSHEQRPSSSSSQPGSTCAECRSTCAKCKCTVASYVHMPSSAKDSTAANCNDNDNACRACFVENADCSHEDLRGGSNDAVNSHCEVHGASDSAVTIGSIEASTDALTGKTKRRRKRKPNFHFTAAQRRMLDGTNDFINTEIPRAESPVPEVGQDQSSELQDSTDPVHEEHACAAEDPSVPEGHAYGAEEDVKVNAAYNTWKDRSRLASVSEDSKPANSVMRTILRGGYAPQYAPQFQGFEVPVATHGAASCMRRAKTLFPSTSPSDEVVGGCTTIQEDDAVVFHERMSDSESQQVAAIRMVECMRMNGSVADTESERLQDTTADTLNTLLDSFMNACSSNNSTVTRSLTLRLLQTVSGSVTAYARSGAMSTAACSSTIDICSQASKLDRFSEPSRTEDLMKECESEPCKWSDGPPELSQRRPKSAPLIVSPGELSLTATPEGLKSALANFGRPRRKEYGCCKRMSSKNIFRGDDFARALADRLNAVLATRGGYNSRKVNVYVPSDVTSDISSALQPKKSRVPANPPSAPPCAPQTLSDPAINAPKELSRPQVAEYSGPDV